MKRISSITAVISFPLFVGCAVGPDYTPPQVAVPGQSTVAPARGTRLESGKARYRIVLDTDF